MRYSKTMKQTRFLIIILTCLGCQTKIRQPVIQVSLINNGSSLKIAGISSLIMQDISRDSVSNWQALAPVYRMPADTDLKNYQPAQPGLYQIKDNAVVFTPDTPFVKQQTYFLRYYNYESDDNLWNYIKGKKHPGKLRFSDLIFKR